MIILTVTNNQGNQRLDRFLKKYFDNSSLSYIYKLIRKDVKINGKRVREDYFLVPGDEMTIYIDEEIAKSLQKPRRVVKAKRQFKIAYEDENIIVVNKPLGVLTHGDKTDKKNHLANQVVDYLVETGQYAPSRDVTFSPAPANRLDRNTTGLVIFGKNAGALQQLNKLIREKTEIHKIYLTVVSGKLDKELTLCDIMVKDHDRNLVHVKDRAEVSSFEKKHSNGSSKEESSREKDMVSFARPIKSAKYNGSWYTLVEVEIVTGRTHQIRVQLANSGFPILGDTKYGNRGVNRIIGDSFGITTQLLHSYKLVFEQLDGVLTGLSGKEIIGQPPERFILVVNKLFNINEEHIK